MTEANPIEPNIEITRFGSSCHHGNVPTSALSLRGAAEPILFVKAVRYPSTQRASWSAAALQKPFDNDRRRVGLGVMLVSSFTATVLGNLGMLEAVLLGASLWQAPALAGSDADTETNHRFATYDGCLNRLLAAPVCRAPAGIGLRSCRLAITVAAWTSRPLGAFSARPTRATAFEESTA